MGTHTHTCGQVQLEQSFPNFVGLRQTSISAIFSWCPKYITVPFHIVGADTLMTIYALT